MTIPLDLHWISVRTLPLSGSGAMYTINWPVFYSGSREALAHCRWPVHVGLPYHAGLQTSRSVTLHFSAGSSSLPLTTSGISSEDIAHTCGRYGYVTKIAFLLGFVWPTEEPHNCFFLTAIGLLADAGSHAFGSNREHDRL